MQMSAKINGFKIFLVCALGHFLILNVLGFSFKNPTTSVQPEVKFLGGILQKQDLLNPMLDKKEEKIPTSTLNAQGESNQQDFKSLSKPPVSFSDSDQKITLKIIKPV